MKRPLLTILLTGFVININAQIIERDAVSSGGDFYANPAGQLSITIGEPMIATVSGGGNELTQGFQQTKISTVGIEDFEIGFDLNIFPNPTMESITIHISNMKEYLSYSLYTFEGKLLAKQKIKNSNTSIELLNYPSASYLLKIMVKESTIKTYQIQKI